MAFNLQQKQVSLFGTRTRPCTKIELAIPSVMEHSQEN